MTESTLNREKLREGKYTRSFAQLTSDQLEGSLWWSIREGSDHPRVVVALEAIKNFRYEPLTLE